MKTFRHIFAFTFITILLASCSTSNDVVGGVFQKRKYNKGFYWNRNSKLPNDKGSDVAQKYESDADKGSEIRFDNSVNTLDKKEIEIQSNNSQPQDYTKPVMSDRTVNVAPEVQKEKSVSSTDENSAPENSVNNQKKNKTSFHVLQQKMIESTSKSESGVSDVAVILLVILAIIIPPLAVILYEGASGRFIVVLIIWLLALFGFFLYPIAGLLYLIAMIYALLIVLGVV